MKNVVAVTLIMVLMAVSGTLAAEQKNSGVAAAKRAPAEPPAVADQVLVRFRPMATAQSIAEAHAKAGGEEMRRFPSVPNLALVKLPPGKPVAEALAAYRSQPDIAYATRDDLYKLKATPNDPYFVEGKLWGLQNRSHPGVDIHATDAWNLTTGSNQVVAMVIDSGIDYTHQDLAANMWRNTADCFHDGIDHDHDGYVNDCYGINPAYGNSDPMDDTQANSFGPSHGTFMAGIIGAVGNNAIGVVGVNWRVGLMACKAFDSNLQGSVHAIIGCLDYALMMKQRGVNIVATNNSYGGAYNQALYDAIVEQINAGILFIAPAGNGLDEDQPFMDYYPANYDLPNVIAVAALDSDDNLNPYSGFGAHTVHLGAPGWDIFSTTIGNGYDIQGGTSNATAFVTGVAALLKARNSSWDWRAIKNLILTGGDNDPALRNILNDTITGKRLNAYGSMTCVNSPIQRRFRPVGTGTLPINIPLGSRIGLSMLNINCAAPAGPPGPVIVQPGNLVIPLLDNGQGPDSTAGDGLYSGVWVPQHPGFYTLTFPGNDQWQAQVFPAYTYKIVPFSWQAISGTSLNLSDDSFQGVSLPFPIVLGNVSFRSIFIDSNGKVNFPPPLESDYQNVSLPNPYAGYSYMVAPFWDDLLPIQNSQQNVFWAVTGTMPNRKFVVEWRNVSRASGCQDAAAKVTFQVVFSEASTEIDFNYANTTFGGPAACAAGDHGASATVGLQTIDPVAAQFSYNQPSLSDKMSIRFNLLQ
jgi:subtilisin family serine protease